MTVTSSPITKQTIQTTTLDKDVQNFAEQLWLSLIPYISYLDSADAEIVELAFWQMVEAHGEQKRKSGVFYISHPVATCINLAQLKLDKNTLAAGLLHDVPEDTEVSLQDIEVNFGSEIAFLVHGVTKFSKIKYRGEERYAETLRKMFVAMSKDIRVIIIKLADRIHNLETLSYLPAEKAQRIALESLEIYAPLASRLGISLFVDRLQEAAFPYVHPAEYNSLLLLPGIEKNQREHALEIILHTTEQVLNDQHLPYKKIYGRTKKYYSIYKKLKLDKDISRIHDLIAIRIIVDSIEECYQILSALHGTFQPMSNRTKDYIIKPKRNGYRSIHSTVYDEATKTYFEFQIRTQEMHDQNEYGVAAHWAYKQSGSDKTEQFLDPQNLKWIQELIDIGQENTDHQVYLQKVKLDLFEDVIFVMTPNEDVISLPEGATPLDFAFKIHQDIGYHASMAIVNDKAVKLNTELKTGDIVRIITNKSSSPKPDWLQWVVRPDSIRTIRQLLRKAEKF
jgi:GTP diphosphokinase / guanosine-3',5'-bis(diphosphate) 3'-diphosphatase